MYAEIGIILAFAAMLCWGIGDFMMQRSTKRFGSWETIFVITFFGMVVLFPFVYKEIPSLISQDIHTIIILLLSSAVYLFASYFDLEALRKGKLAVIEPLYSLEIPVSSLAAFLILREFINSYQIALIVALVIGLLLVSVKSEHLHGKAWLERGVLLGALAASSMGIANFLIGISSRATSPLLAKWFFDTLLFSASLIALLYKHKLSLFWREAKKNQKFVLSMSFFDNAAWLSFGFAMVLAPIAIAVAISQSYIVLAVLLGIFINKEKLLTHQTVGLVVAIIAVIFLSTSIR